MHIQSDKLGEGAVWDAKKSEMDRVGNACMKIEETKTVREMEQKPHWLGGVFWITITSVIVVVTVIVVFSVIVAEFSVR